MSKKLFLTLAPLLAITALALIPATSGAAIRYYKNFPPTSEYTPGGGHTHVIAWGKLTLSPEPAVAAVTTCENAAGGWIENPATLTANGIGATERFATWDCSNAECPAGNVVIGGNEFAKEFEVVSPPQSFPWTSEQVEGEGVPRTKTDNVVVELACMAHKFTRANAGEGKGAGKEGGENEQFVLPTGGAPTVTCVTIAGTHDQKPEDVLGTSASSPAKLVFGGGVGNAGAGSLSCAGGGFEGKTKESLKVMNYLTSGVVNGD